MDTDADRLSILALTTSYPTSAADYRGRFIFEWALGLQALGASVRVIGPRSTSVAQGVPYHGFRHYPGLLMNTGAPETLQERKLWGTVVGAAVTVEMARMARARSKEGDLIVSHWLTPTAFAGLAAHRNNGCPVHAYAHGSDVALLEAIPRMVGQRLVRMLDRQLKGMTFVSGQLQDRFNELLGRTPRTRQTVLPMGFTQNEVDEDFLKDLRERAHGRPVISTLGRLVPIRTDSFSGCFKSVPPAGSPQVRDQRGQRYAPSSRMKVSCLCPEQSLLRCENRSSLSARSLFNPVYNSANGRRAHRFQSLKRWPLGSPAS